VAYCVHGQKFVGFHIHTFENIWSGWHGAWQHNGDILDVELYYQEKISLFKFHRAGQCYNLVHAGEAISVTAHITMLPMLQNQIADISYHLSQCAARDSLRWHSVSQDLCGVAMSVPGFLVFDLESWCDFHREYNAISKLDAIRLWEGMAVNANVGRLEDIMGVLHLRFATATLKECSTEKAMAAFFRDILQSNEWTASVPPAGGPLTPTSIGER
jgi:hypothetical protein